MQGPTMQGSRGNLGYSVIELLYKMFAPASNETQPAALPTGWRSNNMLHFTLKTAPMLRTAALAICLSAVMGTAGAQTTTAPSYGAVGVRPPTQSETFKASSGNEMLRHRGPTGSPCLDVGGFARRHTTVSNLYDHVIAVKNNCALRISIQVCYYNTQNCLPIEIPGGERKEAILGTMPSTRDFRFEFREKF